MTAHPPRILAEAGFADVRALERGPNGRVLCRRCKTECTKKQQTFCSPLCIHEWRLRSQPDYARALVWERDKGRCALCPTVCTRKNAGGVPWEMDHVLPVVEGGGSCAIENLRTLCRPCHLRVTAELTRRRTDKRRQGAV